ncbi:MAG: FISUMP domain-containing protein [Candidatus Falkowbacteria bacterium]
MFKIKVSGVNVARALVLFFGGLFVVSAGSVLAVAVSCGPVVGNSGTCVGFPGATYNTSYNSALKAYQWKCPGMITFCSSNSNATSSSTGIFGATAPAVVPPSAVEAGKTQRCYKEGLDASCNAFCEQVHAPDPWPSVCHATGWEARIQSNGIIDHNNNFFSDLSSGCSNVMYTNLAQCISGYCNCAYYVFNYSLGNICRIDSKTGKAIWGKAECTDDASCLKYAAECATNKNGTKGYNTYTSTCADCECKKNIEFVPCNPGWSCMTDAEHIAAASKGTMKLRDFSTALGVGCYKDPCDKSSAVNGGWSDLKFDHDESAGECNYKTCSKAIARVYKRVCNNPAPNECGKDCEGSDTVMRPVNVPCFGNPEWVKGDEQKKVEHVCSATKPCREDDIITTTYNCDKKCGTKDCTGCADLGKVISLKDGVCVVQNINSDRACPDRKFICDLLAAGALPTGAKWWTVGSYQQKCEVVGGAGVWTPKNSTTSYNTEQSSTECRYICDENHIYDESSRRCVGKTKINDCPILTNKCASYVAGHSVIIQTYNDTLKPPGYAPSDEAVKQLLKPVYFAGNSSVVKGCDYECSAPNTHYDIDKKACVPDTRLSECTDLQRYLRSAVKKYTIVGSKFKQTWTCASGPWTPPAKNMSYKSADGECSFACDENNGYIWDGKDCIKLICDPKKCEEPNQVGWKWVADGTFNRTVDRTARPPVCIPSKCAAAHVGDISDCGCFYDCADDYTWDASTKKCINERTVDCTPKTLPAYTKENSVTRIKQTYSKAKGWTPANGYEYDTVASDSECRYHCLPDDKDYTYTWVDAATGCTRTAKPKDCGGTDPTTDPTKTSCNYVIGPKKYTDPYRPSSWTYSKLQDGAATESAPCTWHCAANSSYANGICVPDTQPYNCSGKPDNSFWNLIDHYDRTWNCQDGTFNPDARTAAYTPNDQPSNPDNCANGVSGTCLCLWSCDKGYVVNSDHTACVLGEKKCDAKPEPGTEWNTKDAKDTYIGTNPGTIYSETEGDCHYKCATSKGYAWDPIEKKCLLKCGGNPPNLEPYDTDGKTSLSVILGPEVYSDASYVPNVWTNNEKASEPLNPCVWKCKKGYKLRTDGVKGCILIEPKACEDRPTVKYDGGAYDEDGVLRSGGNYRTVKICSPAGKDCQCWLRENLNTAIKPDGSPVSEGRFAPDGKEANYDIYGSLYYWPTAMNGQLEADCTANAAGSKRCRGLCPKGFHVAQDAEYRLMMFNLTTKAFERFDLFDHYISDSYLSQKLANSGSSAFDIQLAGYYNVGRYNYYGNMAYFLTSSSFAKNAFYRSSNTALRRGTLEYESADIKDARNAMSVRCIADDTKDEAASVGKRRLSTCGAPPAGAARNTASSITQIYYGKDWDGKEVWWPSTTPAYSASPSTDYCYYNCASGYSWNGSSCVVANTGCGTVPYDGGPNSGSYDTVKICDLANNNNCQCWLKTNLNTSKKPDGSAITSGRFAPGGDNANYDTYGSLYTWATAMNGQTEESDDCPANTANNKRCQGICPNGWHVAQDAEYRLLLYNLARDKNEHFYDDGDHYLSDSGLDVQLASGGSSGFDVKLAGKNSNYFGSRAFFLTSTQFAAKTFYRYNVTGLRRDFNSGYTMSVRCINNNTIGEAASVGKRRNSNCSALPANTIRNTTSSISQIYYGKDAGGAEVWWPSTSVTYNPGASTNFCYYTCATGYTWNGSACVEINRADCGTVKYDGGPNGGYYDTVKICDIMYNNNCQCWLKTNLNTAKKPDGSAITSGRFAPDGDSSNYAAYGSLYTWDTAMNGQTEESDDCPANTANNKRCQGICPDRWHVAQDAEYRLLLYNLAWDKNENFYLDSHYLSDSYLPVKLADGGQSAWNLKKAGFNDGSRPLGFMGSGNFLTSTQYEDQAFERYSNLGLRRNYVDKNYALSLRCIRNDTVGEANSVGKRRIVDCAAKPANTVWNRTTKISQIYYGKNSLGVEVWWPSTDTTYSNVASNDYCYFKCASGYGWSGTQCLPKNTDACNEVRVVYPATVCNVNAPNYDTCTYPTVAIGTQCWFQTNVNLGQMVNYDYPAAQNQDTDRRWQKYCRDNNTNNCLAQGGLYQWHKAMNLPFCCSSTDTRCSNANCNPALGNATPARGICPVGWHVPTDTDWSILETFLSSSTCVSTRNGDDCNPAGTVLQRQNTQNFKALLAGRATAGSFTGTDSNTRYISSTRVPGSSTTYYFRALAGTSPLVSRLYGSTTDGVSLRCVMDPDVLGQLKPFNETMAKIKAKPNVLGVKIKK